MDRVIKFSNCDIAWFYEKTIIKCWYANVQKDIYRQQYLQEILFHPLHQENISPSHTWLIILIRFITLKNNWMNSFVKTKGKCNESVNNKFKIMSKSNSLHQIIGMSK